MRREIGSELPTLGQPFSWAVTAGGMIYAGQMPVTDEGQVLEGDISEQTALVLANLRRSMETTGAMLDDVVQVQLFLLDAADLPAVDAVYGRHFNAPYPSRAVAIVNGLALPGARISLLAIAALPESR